MTIIKNMIKGTIAFIFLGFVMLKALEWSLYFFVAKPAAEEVAYDVSTYVEANDRFFTEGTLNQYLGNYRNRDMHIRVFFNQHPDDKRFVVKVNVRANWDSIHSSTAYVQTTGVNDGDTPAKSIFARFDSQRDTSTKASPVTAAPIQPEKVSIQEKQNTLEAEPKEQKADASPVRDEDIKELVEKYVKMGMEAIRLKDFSYIEPLLDPQGKIYEESQESIRSIHRKGLTEEVLMVQVQHISENSPTEFIVDTYEEFKITYPDGTDMLKGFNSTYRVKALDNHSLVMNETITVDEVFAEEVQVQSGRLSAEIVKGSCISCHGGSLEGGAGPGLVGLSGRMSEEEIIAILENGKGTMPGGLVSPGEAESLAAFLMGLDE